MDNMDKEDDQGRAILRCLRGMRVHEEACWVDRDLLVLRVPTGWIYFYEDKPPVFVPER